LWSRKNNHW